MSKDADDRPPNPRRQLLEELACDTEGRAAPGHEIGVAYGQPLAPRCSDSDAIWLVSGWRSTYRLKPTLPGALPGPWGASTGPNGDLVSFSASPVVTMAGAAYVLFMLSSLLRTSSVAC